jgi:hypothetical protein
MLLALNFSWYDDPIAIIEQHEKQMQEIADREMQGPEDSSSLDVYQKPTMYIAKNSIEMHMLKSSSLMHAKRRSKLQKDTRRNYYSTNFNSTQNPIMPPNQSTSMIIDNTQNDIVDPKVIQLRELE